MHAKVIIIDDNFASVGSANMDYRSFDLNHEVNAYFYDKAIVAELIQEFEIDKTDSDLVELERWQGRKLWPKLKESVCRLLAPLL